MRNSGEDNFGRPPAVSVLMATYNNELFIDECLESIRRQTFDDFECIVVNDGSTDRTTDILRHHAAADSRIIVIEQENAGLTKSLNRAAGASRGEFLARIDADDVCLSKRLQRQVKFLKGNPDIDVVGTWIAVIDGKGQKIIDHVLPIKHDEIIRCGLSEVPFSYIYHPTVLMRKSAFIKAGGYDEYFRQAQDYDLWFRIARFGKLENIPEALVKRRIHNTSITMLAGAKQQTFALEIHKREMSLRQLETPYKLPAIYEYNIGNRHWLASQSARTGQIDVCLSNSWVLFKGAIRNIYFSVKCVVFGVAIYAVNGFRKSIKSLQSFH